LALVFALALASSTHAQTTGEPGDFDFYVLSLSWSPSWCAREPAADKAAQCSADADFGLIVHGLWPQYEEGYPEFCADEGSAFPAGLVRSMLDIMPSKALVRHTWRKHGTCSGLVPEDYFAVTRAAFSKVAIPDYFESAAEGSTVSSAEVEAAFIQSNAGLETHGIAVSCSDGVFEEIRICLTRDLAFRACPEVDERGCRQPRLQLPAAP
jgi:ribonuclease T2